MLSRRKRYRRRDVETLLAEAAVTWAERHLRGRPQSPADNRAAARAAIDYLYQVPDEDVIFVGDGERNGLDTWDF